MERLLVRLETTADARYCRKYLITQIFLISRLNSRFESLNQNSGWKKKYRTKWFEFKTFSVPVTIEEHLGLQKSWFDSTSFISPFQIDQKIKTLLPNAAAYWSLDALDERSLSYFSLRSYDLSGMLCLLFSSFYFSQCRSKGMPLTAINSIIERTVLSHFRGSKRDWDVKK